MHMDPFSLRTWVVGSTVWWGPSVMEAIRRSMCGVSGAGDPCAAPWDWPNYPTPPCFLCLAMFSVFLDEGKTGLRYHTVIACSHCYIFYFIFCKLFFFETIIPIDFLPSMLIDMFP
jgi:hypothetical protein